MALKNTERFTELEFCLSQYFCRHLAPLMASVQEDLQGRQLQELGEYHSSAAGFLSSLSDSSHMVPGLDSSVQRLQVAGQWNSKTTDDYLDMVRKEISEDKAIQRDMAVIATEWRKAVIDEVGREAYDKASRQIGSDLAYAYFGYRLEEQMIGKMVTDRMPKSSIEYVLRRASERSILGLNSLMRDSPAEQEINKQIESLYKPSPIEQGAVRGSSFMMDVIATGGVGSWSSLAKMAGAEVVISGLEAYTASRDAEDKPLSVEQCISQGVFGSETNVFTDIRSHANIQYTWEHPNLLSLNRQLSKKLVLLETEPEYEEGNLYHNPELQKPTYMLNAVSSEPDPNRRDGIPLVVAPGKEDEYLELQRVSAQQPTSEKLTTEKQMNHEPATGTAQETVPVESNAIVKKERGDSTARQEDANLSGWDGLLQSFGLDGISATGRNLGYVIAMLPDILFGVLTGKSKNLGLEDNLIPIASVLTGLFVRNPLLKMTLIGLGGANLLNKAGKEALDSQTQTVQPVQEIRYKQYADEPLNARLAGVSIHRGALLCTIDKVPSTISLPPATIAAYQAGALPLNTLANAILARHDATQEELAHTYQQQYEQTRQLGPSAGIK